MRLLRVGREGPRQETRRATLLPRKDGPEEHLVGRCTRILSEIAADADKIVQHVLKETCPGSIVLLHAMYEGRGESRKAIPVIIQGLRERGYRFVTVSELLAAAP